MTDFDRHTFFHHAMSQIPREACGLVVQTPSGIEELLICKNISPSSDQFEIDAKDYLRAKKQGTLIGVVHSHCYSSNIASEADVAACQASGVAWHIVSVPCGTWNTILPEGLKVDLIGRRWVHGVLDCYSLIRDYYLEMLNIKLPNFNRDFYWWNTGQNLYIENFPCAGFEVLEGGIFDLKEHDVVLMKIFSPVPNHGAIYVGGNYMLHHLIGRLSCKENFDHYYRRHTVLTLRHREL